MAFEYTGLSYTAEASGDLSGNQYAAVDIDSNGRVVVQVAATAIAGVLQNNPDALGQAATVRHAGVTKAEAGTGGVAAGDEIQVEAAAAGVFIDVGAGVPVGIALGAAAAGEIFPLLLF